MKITVSDINKETIKALQDQIEQAKQNALFAENRLNLFLLGIIGQSKGTIGTEYILTETLDLISKSKETKISDK